MKLKNMRDALNNKVKIYGNKIKSGLGDYLTQNVDTKKIGKLAGAGLIAYSLLKAPAYAETATNFRGTLYGDHYVVRVGSGDESIFSVQSRDFPTDLGGMYKSTRKSEKTSNVTITDEAGVGTVRTTENTITKSNEKQTAITASLFGNRLKKTPFTVAGLTYDKADTSVTSTSNVSVSVPSQQIDENISTVTNVNVSTDSLGLYLGLKAGKGSELTLGGETTSGNANSTSTITDSNGVNVKSESQKITGDKFYVHVSSTNKGNYKSLGYVSESQKQGAEKNNSSLFEASYVKRMAIKFGESWKSSTGIKFKPGQKISYSAFSVGYEKSTASKGLVAEATYTVYENGKENEYALDPYIAFWDQINKSELKAPSGLKDEIKRTLYSIRDLDDVKHHNGRLEFGMEYIGISNQFTLGLSYLDKRGMKYSGRFTSSEGGTNSIEFGLAEIERAGKPGFEINVYKKNNPDKTKVDIGINFHFK